MYDPPESAFKAHQLRMCTCTGLPRPRPCACGATVPQGAVYFPFAIREENRRKHRCSVASFEYIEVLALFSR